MFIGEDRLGFTYLTDEIKNRTIARIHEVVASRGCAATRS